MEVIPAALATPLPNGTRSLPPVPATPGVDGDAAIHSASQPIPTLAGASPGEAHILRNIHNASPIRPSSTANGALPHVSPQQDLGTHRESAAAPLDPHGLFSADSPPPPAPALAPAHEPAAAPVAATPTPVSGPDWTPYDIDTDILSRKLAKHKYHRPSDFLADIDKIKANADRLGDVDRQTKIAELVSHAYLHVAEFDPRWGPEFDAYAERMRVRKAEKERARADKERQVDGIAVPEDAAVDSGTAVAIVDPDAGMGDAAMIGQKRPRQDVAGDVEMDSTIEQPEKRARLGDADRPAAKGPPFPAQMPTPAPADNTATVTSTVPAPQPRAYPPFIVPLDKLEAFTQALRVDTDGWTVEQLEQLRAGIFDRIWKKRAEWDRSGLIDDLASFLSKMSRNIGQRAST